MLFTLINFSVYSQAELSSYGHFLCAFLGGYNCCSPIPVYVGPPTAEHVGWILINWLYRSIQSQWEEQKSGILRSSSQDRAQVNFVHSSNYNTFSLLKETSLPDSYLDLLSKRFGQITCEFTSLFTAFAFCSFLL